MIVQKGALRRALKPLVRILDPRSPRPELSHVRLEANGTELHLTCTDSRTWFSAVAPCDGQFSGVVSAEDLLEFLSPCPAADRSTSVEFNPVEHARVVVATHGAMVELHLSPNTEFPRCTGDSAPASTWLHVATWRGAEFVEAVGWVALAIGSDPARQHLHNILLEGRQVVATDGHRLHVATLEADIEDALLIGGDTLAAFLAALRPVDEVTATRSGDSVRFRSGAFTLETPQVEAKFPAYLQVIPVQGDEAFSVTADRSGLRNAVQRIAGKRKRDGIRLIVNGALTLERITERGTKSVTPSRIGTTHEGPITVIGVDPGYVADALASGGDEVDIRFGDALGPIRFELGRGRVGVVMPMRV